MNPTILIQPYVIISTMRQIFMARSTYSGKMLFPDDVDETCTDDAHTVEKLSLVPLPLMSVGSVVVSLFESTIAKVSAEISTNAKWSKTRTIVFIQYTLV